LISVYDHVSLKARSLDCGVCAGSLAYEIVERPFELGLLSARTVQVSLQFLDDECLAEVRLVRSADRVQLFPELAIALCIWQSMKVL
jgi:hypothetical protein